MHKCIRSVALASLLAALALAPAARAAPAPDPDKAAREKLEALKKRLPRVVTTWAKVRWYGGCGVVSVRSVRRLSANEAKITILSDDPKRDERDANKQELITIYAHYYDGSWVTTRFEATWATPPPWQEKAVRFLMADIDDWLDK